MTALPSRRLLWPMRALPALVALATWHAILRLLLYKFLMYKVLLLSLILLRLVTPRPNRYRLPLFWCFSPVPATAWQARALPAQSGRSST